MNDVKNVIELEPYEAPTIEDMPVRAEEQLLAGCKQPFQQPTGRGGTTCQMCMTLAGS